MLHPSIIVKDSGIQGKGLFATADIKAGEVTWRQGPDEARYHIDTIKSWPPKRQERFWRYAYQVGDGWYHGPESGVVTDPADYMNHSCDPNTWFVDDALMLARRDIKKGEEITYDYATSETAESFVLHCKCGAPNCRKTVRGTDYRMNRAMQERYGPHVMAHVLKGVSEK